MRFEFEGRSYLIEFERSTSFRGVKQSKYPYTTATVFEVKKVQKISGEFEQHTPVRTWTSGCYFRDKFSYEEGRRAALRGALYDDPRGSGSKLSKAFKTAVWNAYFSRWKDGAWRLK